MAPNDDWSDVCARSGLDRLLGAFVDFVCDVCVSKTVSRPENLSVRDRRFSARSVKGSRAPFYGWINRLDPMMLRNVALVSRAPIRYHLPYALLPLPRLPSVLIRQAYAKLSTPVARIGFVLPKADSGCQFRFMLAKIVTLERARAHLARAAA